MVEYKIERHGGRSVDKWKIKFCFNDLENAEIKYNEMWKKIRQGSIRLIADNEILKEYSCPLLRRLW